MDVLAFPEKGISMKLFILGLLSVFFIGCSAAQLNNISSEDTKCANELIRSKYYPAGNKTQDLTLLRAQILCRDHTSAQLTKAKEIIDQGYFEHQDGSNTTSGDFEGAANFAKLYSNKAIECAKKEYKSIPKERYHFFRMSAECEQLR
jgi:hypothetical protein